MILCFGLRFNWLNVNSGFYFVGKYHRNSFVLLFFSVKIPWQSDCWIFSWSVKNVNCFASRKKNQKIWEVRALRLFHLFFDLDQSKNGRTDKLSELLQRRNFVLKHIRVYFHFFYDVTVTMWQMPHETINAHDTHMTENIYIKKQQQRSQNHPNTQNHLKWKTAQAVDSFTKKQGTRR